MNNRIPPRCSHSPARRETKRLPVSPFSQRKSGKVINAKANRKPTNHRWNPPTPNHLGLKPGNRNKSGLRGGSPPSETPGKRGTAVPVGSCSSTPSSTGLARTAGTQW